MRGSELIEVQSGEASHASVRAMAKALLEPAFLAEVHTLRAMLPEDMTPEQRARNCAAVVCYMLSTLDPVDPTPPADIVLLTQVSPRFMQTCSPLSKYRWKAHLDVQVQDKRAITALCSPYLYNIICGAEDLWGAPGHLVRRP
jgi:hypothetical protein